MRQFLQLVERAASFDKMDWRVSAIPCNQKRAFCGLLYSFNLWVFIYGNAKLNNAFAFLAEENLCGSQVSVWQGQFIFHVIPPCVVFQLCHAPLA
jgi:hypothetical protein